MITETLIAIQKAMEDIVRGKLLATVGTMYYRPETQQVYVRTKERYERMQTPEGRAAMQAAFQASPDELGEVAVQPQSHCPSCHNHWIAYREDTKTSKFAEACADEWHYR